MGIELEGMVVVRDACLVVVLGCLNGATPFIMQGVQGLERDGDIVVGQRRIEISL